MIYISHRGNLNGPDPKKENTIEATNDCIEKVMKLRLIFGMKIIIFTLT